MANSACFAGLQAESGLCKQSNSLVEHPIINNNYDLYPKLYYWTMSWFASEDVISSTLMMRVVNSVFSIALISLVILTSPKYLRRMTILSLFLTSIPLGTFLIASTNPSSWSYIGLLVLMTSFINFLSSTNVKSQIISGVLSLVGFSMATGARADAAPYAALAIILSWIITRPNRKKTWINALVSTALLLSAVYIFQSTGTATSIVSGHGLRLPDAITSTPSFSDNVSKIPELWAGVFGTWGLGWLDTPMPGIVWVTTLGIFFGVIFSSLSGFDLRQTIAFGLAALSLMVVPLYVLMSNELSVGEQLQPRYLLPLVVFLVSVATFRQDFEAGFILSLGQMMVIGCGLVLANSVALHTNIRRYTTGLDLKGINLDTRIEWWWETPAVSPNLVWVLGSLSFALTIYSLWRIRYQLGYPTTNLKQKTIRESI
jgi:hypothetical protein